MSYNEILRSLSELKDRVMILTARVEELKATIEKGA